MTFICSRAVKGVNYIRLYDENNVKTAAFEEVVDFSAFTIEGGEWEAGKSTQRVMAEAAADENCFVLAIKDKVLVEDGLFISFDAPLGSTGITSLSIDSIHYLFVDAAHTIVGDASECFVAGARLEVILSIIDDQRIAYLQNGVSSSVGKKTEQGAEIFNDYTTNKALTEYSHAEGATNIAGTYAFNIIDAIEGDRTYVLDSVEGLEIGDVISIKWFNSYINCAKISYIDHENNIVCVDKLVTNSDKTSPRKLFVIAKPEIGTAPFDGAAHAEGVNTQAVLAGCHAEGGNTKAMGRYAHAEGVRTEAIYAAHAEGQDSKALGEASHAEGGYTTANANFSHAEGYKTITSGEGASHAEGGETTASGRRSHAEGSLSTASGLASHAEGFNTEATNEYAHAEGQETDAYGRVSHAEGYQTKAIGDFAHSEGNNTTSSGQATHAEGIQAQATVYAAHAEGNITKARNTAAHAEGSSTIADGIGSHSEGIRTRAVGAGSHAEGFVDDGCQDDYGAPGKCAHTEGYNTIASGEAAHAEGYNTVASGMYSHAGGMGTKATAQAQTSIGKYNKEDADALFIVGNGTGYSASSRKNAFAVKKDGSAEIQTVGDSDNSVINKKYVADTTQSKILSGTSAPSNDIGVDGDIYIQIIE